VYIASQNPGERRERKREEGKGRERVEIEKRVREKR